MTVSISIQYARVRSSTIASRLAACSSARMPAPTFCLVAMS